MKNVAVFDVETYPNYCMVGFKELSTGKVKQFDCSEGSKIKKYISKHTIVGFNSNNYDNVIVLGMISGLSVKELYKISFDLIEGDGQRWDYEHKIANSIDIMEVAPQQASLKLYGARIGVKKLQDLPYPPHEKLTKKQKKEVAKYNVNDLDLTEALFNALQSQLKIRENLGDKYGIDVMSRSDAQVAEDVFKKVLGITKKPSIDKPKVVHYTAPKYIEFKSKTLKQLKKNYERTNYRINLKTGKFHPIDWLSENKTVTVHGVEYTIGIGGLHSNEKSVAYKGNIKNADISSMYPSLIINSGKYPIQLGSEWLNIYKAIVNDRLKAKKKANLAKLELKKRGIL